MNAAQEKSIIEQLSIEFQNVLFVQHPETEKGYGATYVAIKGPKSPSLKFSFGEPEKDYTHQEIPEVVRELKKILKHLHKYLSSGKTKGSL